jgi:hypothetical protein
MCKKTIYAILLVLALVHGAALADEFVGLSDVTVEGNMVIVSLRYEGKEYVVANEDLILGTTTRWYVEGGNETLWEEGAATPAATVTGTSTVKGGDVGSKADNFLFQDSGTTNISSIDGINFQETIFPDASKLFFHFERGGNDTGTWEAIYADGSRGKPVQFTGAAMYVDTGVKVGDQNAFGVVFITDRPAIGVRITASGHDTFSISIPKPEQILAVFPSPEDAGTDVPREVTLGWTPGKLAGTHNIYLGTSFADVNEGSSSVLVSQGQDANSFDTDRLEFDQVHYWRVDEVNATPDKTVFTGSVWSFAVEPIAIPVETLTVTASGGSTGMDVENTINGSGLNAVDQHSNIPTDMWLTDATDAWIQYEFDNAYQLHELLVWNSNQAIESFIGFGVKDVVVETSVDGVTWTQVQGVPPLAKASGLGTYTANTVVDLSGIVAKYVKIIPQNAHGMTGQLGLSEVRFMFIPTAPRKPNPASESMAGSVDVTLAWRAGREAASHDVRFSADQAAVANGTAPIETVSEASYVTGALNYAATYYWQVTEVNDAETPAAYTGPVWSFTTPDSGSVEDFETYTAEEGEEVFMAWFDGFGGDASLGGSITGHIDGPFVETVIVSSGRQSLPFYYDNDGGFFDIDGKSSSPNFSEVLYEFDSPQDWTVSGIKSLSIMFYGAVDNTGQLYCKIDNVKVVFDGDPDAIASETWVRWDIDLTAVATNVARVRSLAIGIDGGGSGLLYVDDIRARSSAAVPAQ